MRQAWQIGLAGYGSLETAEALKDLRRSLPEVGITSQQTASMLAGEVPAGAL